MLLGAVQTVLPVPTVELAKAECDEFDRENFLAETALGELLAQFPRNTDTSHVLLKVLVLNKLYSTRIRDIDVDPLARHIGSLGVDRRLSEGSVQAVDLIADCPTLKRYYSFATKFCSWHNPDAYPFTTVVLMNVSGRTTNKIISQCFNVTIFGATKNWLQ
jgi:hypothetical protein